MIFNNKQIVFIVPTETATNTIRNTRSVEKQADVIFLIQPMLHSLLELMCSLKLIPQDVQK